MQPDHIDRRLSVEAADLARFTSLTQDDHKITCFAIVGIRHAEQYVVPRIISGLFGDTAEEIEAGVARYAATGEAAAVATPEAARMTDDELFVWRVGFKHAAREAQRAYLDSLRPPLLTVMALSLGARRPLGLADFGCLPMPGRK